MNRRLLVGGPGPWLAGAVSVALFASPWLVPILGVVVSLFCPVPLILAYWRWGRGAGRLATGAATLGAVALFPFNPPYLGGLYYLYYAASALGLAEGLFLLRREDWATALGAGAGLVALGILFWGAGALDGQGVLAAWEVQWRQELDMVVGSYQQMGLSAQEAAELKERLAATSRLLYRLAPGVLAAGALLLAWSSLLLARRLARRLAPERAAHLDDLTRFRVPEPLVWPLIAAGGLMALADGWPFWLGANILAVLVVLYFFQGLAIVLFWCEKKHLPRFVRLGFYLLLMVEVFLALPVAAVGLFDMWIDFRKLKAGAPPTA